MAKTTVAALAAEVETLTAQVEALAKLVQVSLEAPKPAKKPASRKPKAADVKPASKPNRKEANKLAHRQFLAFYGRGEAAKAKAAIPERWLAQEFYASRLAEIS
jgi:outer membrane murein-binding lipoprotein Lpp